MHPFLIAALFILAYMIFWFTLGQIQKDNSIVDAAWGLGFVGVVAFCRVLGGLLLLFRGGRGEGGAANSPTP